MKGPFIPKETTLYFALFPDRALYATGPQQDIAGGPIGYLDRDMAEQVANVINGSVEPRSLEAMVEFCQERGCVLYIRYANGLTASVPETIVANPDPDPKLTKVEGVQRQELIDLAEQQKP